VRVPASELAIVWIAGALACVLVRALRRAAVDAAVDTAIDAKALGAPLDVRGSGAAWLAAVARAASELGLSRAPRIAVLGTLAQPAVSGLWNPRLLLPEGWLARMPGRADRHSLLHEMAHLKRADLWLDEVCALVRALFWFHPLVWVALRRVRTLTELACDASVAALLDADPDARGGGARAYRETLIRTACTMAEEAAPSGSLGFLAHGSSIVLRIERLQLPAPARGARVRAGSAVLAAALCACVLPMATPGTKLRAAAQRVFDAELAGTPQSCFSLQAAAMVLAADEPTSKKSSSKSGH
jgi:beta-lactamase regulating signal transducer with metallopeptidase domain